MPTSLVPTVDIGGGPAADVVEALVGSSCAFVTGHGVAEAVRDELFDVSRQFFDLPGEEKARVRWPGDGIWRGWQPLSDGTVDIRDGSRPELLERFEVQLASPGAGTDGADGERAAAFALWPERPERFRLAWTRYYAALRGVANSVMTSIAEVLGLPRDELTDWTDDHYANLVVNNYLDLVECPAPGKLRQRPHTDIGGLTVLWADDAPGGLEVRMPGVPGWTAVRFPPEAYLVQAGDLLARWTNQTIRANIHQVANPPAGRGTSSQRISAVYFHYPKLDTIVTPAPSCVSAQRPPGHPIDAGAHLRDAIARPGARYRELEAALASAE